MELYGFFMRSVISMRLLMAINKLFLNLQFGSKCKKFLKEGPKN